MHDELYEGGSELKVYVVTAGCYSDYHIEGVFTDPIMANQYANLDSDREVEEYDADVVEIATAPIKARIWYDPKKNEITEISTASSYMEEKYRPAPDEYRYKKFVVERKLSARTLKDVQEHGLKSPLLLKHMQDSWAMFKAMNEPEEEEEDKEIWIRCGPEEASEAFKTSVNMYNIMFASTSSNTGEMIKHEQDELH